MEVCVFCSSRYNPQFFGLAAKGPVEVHTRCPKCLGAIGVFL